MEIYWTVLAILLWMCNSPLSVSGELRHKRLTNGTFISKERYPYVVKVTINEVNCTGFILNKRFVATGRQCIGDYRKTKSGKNDAKIYAGFRSLKKTLDNIHEGVQVVKIISAYCYAEDNKNSQLPDDLCLVKVFPRFAWTSTVKLAKLKKEPDWAESKTKSCVVASYGDGFEGDNAWTLRTATVDVKHPRSCASLNASKSMERRLLCSNLEAGMEPCRGDAGAPLVCDNNIVAILQGSETKVCGEPVDEVAFIYLSPYIEFIETVLWSQPERYRVRIRSNAVSYISNPQYDVRYYILFFIIYKLTLEKRF